jgi:uncharacterized protein
MASSLEHGGSETPANPANPAKPLNRRRPFLTAEWRHLLMLNYPVEGELLEPLVPPGTMLDTYQGVAYLTVVGFVFSRTKVWGVPIPWHQSFEEVNLRFYVRRFSGVEWRRGVVFIRELVPKRIVATAARAIYNERYLSVPMEHVIQPQDNPQFASSVEYRWRLENRWNYVRASTTRAPREVAVGSLEEFITEHYWGYVRQRDGTTVEYEVEHPRWGVSLAEATELNCEAARFHDHSLVPALSQPPICAFIADGSPVTVYRGGRLPPPGRSMRKLDND